MRSTDVAACLAGEPRSLATHVVAESYRAHVQDVLSKAGHRLDTFVSLAGRRDEALERAIVEAYSPVEPLLWTATDFLWNGSAVRCRLALQLDDYGRAPMAQWVGIRGCFRLIEAAEARRATEYAWLLRLRTDMVLLSDIWLPPDAPTPAHAHAHAYVPAGGMSADYRFACMNDHLFACPRRLCAPYFTLLDVFANESCAAPAAGHPLEHGGRLRAPPARLSTQWYMFRLYGGGRELLDNVGAPAGPAGGAGISPREQPHCSRRSASTLGEHCCGELRELPLHYAIARCGKALECTKRLRWTWRKELEGPGGALNASAHREARDEAWRRCRGLIGRPGRVDCGNIGATPRPWAQPQQRPRQRPPPGTMPPPPPLPPRPSTAATVPVASNTCTVQLLAQHSHGHGRECSAGVSFGCVDGAPETIWVDHGCRGTFRCGSGGGKVSCGTLRAKWAMAPFSSLSQAGRGAAVGGVGGGSVGGSALRELCSCNATHLQRCVPDQPADACPCSEWGCWQRPRADWRPVRCRRSSLCGKPTADTAPPPFVAPPPPRHRHSNGNDDVAIVTALCHPPIPQPLLHPQPPPQPPRQYIAQFKSLEDLLRSLLLAGTTLRRVTLVTGRFAPYEAQLQALQTQILPIDDVPPPPWAVPTAAATATPTASTHARGGGGGGNANVNSGTFVKLRLLELTQFSRVIFLDNDVQVLRSIDFLANPAVVEAPAVAFSQPDSAQVQGGINSGVMVLEPSRAAAARLFALMGSMTPDHMLDGLLHRGPTS